MERQFLRGKERSAKYEQAVKALRELAQAEGSDHAQRAFAEATCDIQEREFAEFLEVKRSAGHSCIRRLLGKHCDGLNRPDGIACRTPVSDHDTLWNREGKPALYVAQPYHVRLSDLRNLVELCDRHELDAQIDAGPAFHNPGGVLHVEIFRRGEHPREAIIARGGAR